MRVAITTLGCKANWSDSEAIAQRLAAAGLCVVDFEDSADAYVINTCTVTRLADAQSRQMLRRAIKRRPGAIVIATGCYGETCADELRRVAGVDRVFGTSDREAMIDHILELAGASRRESEMPSAVGPVPAGPQSRARAFLKIQDGCDRRCAYCIITKARGRSRSQPPDEIVRMARELGRHHEEIVLAGIDIGQYGSDLPGRPALADVVARLACDPGVPRVRLSSLTPNRVDAGLVRQISAGGVCRHVHLSIQSCSDPVLRGMRRGYSASEVEGAVQRLTPRVPGIAITGDVIAGLPGETDADHEATLGILEGLPMAGLHVFPFSSREGTDAARMEGQVPGEVKRRRAAQLRSLATRKRRSFLRGLIGERLDAIVTSRKAGPDGQVRAFSDNAVEISLPAGKVGYARMGRAVIERVDGLTAHGRWE